MFFKIRETFNAFRAKPSEGGGEQMTDAELLAKIKRCIPKSMEGERDLCLLQAYFRGHADGVKLEREECLKVLEGSLAGALAKMIHKEPS